MDTFIEAEAMAFDWQIRVFQKAMEHHQIDIAVIYSVYLDSVNHRYRSLLEGVEKGSPEQLAEAREIYGKAYALADTFLGRILDLVPEETTVAVLSDHGSVGYDTTLDPWKALEAEGLLFFRDGKVEWEKTRAYPSSTCHVYVNLKGRDTLGIVEEKDFKETVGMVIRALQKQFGEKLAFALRNEEAGLVGQGGERSGDVVYGISGSRAGGIIGGVHAMQIPTARTETGDIRSLLVLSGPRFKKDILLDRCVHLYDIAPTLCHALGYPQPDQAEGAVAYQAFLPA
ncbi:MAG: alkaline phosphatase family protein [Clostridia bacterium]